MILPIEQVFPDSLLLTMHQELPITGIVGVVGGAPGEVEAALRTLEASGASRPDALEVRADLFDRPWEAVEVLELFGSRVPIIFTVRLKSHGGRWEGDEFERVRLSEEALRRGATLVDAEWDSPAARELSQRAAPLVVSHHDFKGMMEPGELRRITCGMLELRPWALKCVPTATSQQDGVQMLEWIAQAGAEGPRRLGFAMGEMGLPSRVLSIAWGAPYTYAAMARAVAPGQVSVSDLRGLYRSPNLSRRTRVYGVVGNPVAHSLSPYLHNRAFSARSLDAVYLPLRINTFPELLDVVDSLGIDGLSVTLPFKEDALRAAHEADERARSAGAANTLLIDRSVVAQRSPEATARIRAFNTDFDGVLEPLHRRRLQLPGLSVAIIGNGGAARGAAKALLAAGAMVTLYYRNAERGEPVARSLGARGRNLGDFTPGSHQLIVNATSLGLHHGDGSPLSAKVFDPNTWAFEMIYDPPETQFLVDARAAGAQTITGREMLICQGRAQFKLFTGEEVSYEEFEAAFLEGQTARRGG